MTAPDNRSHEEAAKWFACRRRGVMTLQERADYAAWSRDPANSAAMAAMGRIWQLAGLAGSVRAGIAGGKRSATPARSALLAILCVASLGAGMIAYGGHSDFWTRLDWTER
jgi:ferric-dicitrate binding protein FerR (iron transport regulator)